MPPDADQEHVVALPADLPPCWWVAAHSADGSVELCSAHDSRAEAREEAAFTRR
jgi:hypothetical protein